MTVAGRCRCVALMCVSVAAIAACFVAVDHSMSIDSAAAAAAVRMTTVPPAAGAPTCQASAAPPPLQRVLVAVFPGTVAGAPPADRRRRLGALADAWPAGELPTFHGVAIDFIFVEDRAKPERDTGFIDFSSSRRFLNVSAMEERLGLLPPSAKDDMFAVYRVLFAAFFGAYAAGQPTYDWLFSMHDHAAVFPMNLACYVRRHHHRGRPFAAGSVLQIDGGRNTTRFISDAAGLLLNQAAVQKLIATRCAPLAKWHRDGPTHRIAECLIEHGVELTPALDDRGAELMNVYTPVRVVHGKTDPWYDTYKANAGLGHSAKRKTRVRSLVPITFHYVDAAESSAIAAIVKAAEPHGGAAKCPHTAAMQLPLSNRAIFDMYPDAAAAGVYSRPLSSESDPTIAYLSDVATNAWRPRCSSDGAEPQPTPGAPLAKASDDP